MSIKTRISYYRDCLFSFRTSALQFEISTKKRTIKLVLTSKIKATLLQQIAFLRRILSDPSFCQFSDTRGRSLGQIFIGCPSWSTRSPESPGAAGGGGSWGKLRMEKWLSLRKQLMELSVEPEESEGSHQTVPHIHPIIMWSSHDITHLTSRCFLVYFLLSGGNIREWGSFWKLPINLGSPTVRDRRRTGWAHETKTKGTGGSRGPKKSSFYRGRGTTYILFYIFSLWTKKKNTLVY